MFLERKVTAEIRGGEPFRHFSAIQGWDALQYSVCTLSISELHQEITCPFSLHCQKSGILNTET